MTEHQDTCKTESQHKDIVCYIGLGVFDKIVVSLESFGEQRCCRGSELPDSVWQTDERHGSNLLIFCRLNAVCSLSSLASVAFAHVGITWFSWENVCSCARRPAQDGVFSDAVLDMLTVSLYLAFYFHFVIIWRFTKKQKQNRDIPPGGRN